MYQISKIYLKPWPNDRNMPMQHIATLLGTTSCMCLATLLQHVVTCWVLLAQIWPFSNLNQQHPTRHNPSQQGGQTCATCCAQQCCNMLCWYVAIVWPALEMWSPQTYLQRSLFIHSNGLLLIHQVLFTYKRPIIAGMLHFMLQYYRRKSPLKIYL